MKIENRNFGIIQGVMIALSVISIVVVVAFKIIGNQVTSELTANAGINCTQNSTGGSVDVLYTACGDAYDGLRSLQTEVTNSVSWIGIAVVVVIGFALIYMMSKRQ